MLLRWFPPHLKPFHGVSAGIQCKIVLWVLSVLAFVFFSSCSSLFLHIIVLRLFLHLVFPPIIFESLYCFYLWDTFTRSSHIRSVASRCNLTNILKSLYFCKCLAFRIKPQKCWECVCATDVLRESDDPLSLPAGSTCPQTVTSADRHQRGDPVLLFGKMERSTKLDDLAPSGSLRDL